MYLLFVVSIGDSQETLRKKNLELLDEEILRIVDADEGTDDIAWFVRAEVYRVVDDQTRDHRK